MKEFIEQLPKYESHYCHSRSQKLYLAPTLTISKLYELYETRCKETNQKPVSDYTFRKIFNEDFNITIHPSLKDTCKTCDMLNAKIKACTGESSANAAKVQLEIHQRKAENARAGLHCDNELCKTDPYVTVLTFDLEKTLPTPVISTGICYMKIACIIST